ncbi:MAG: haloacid dehalogenase-like hydrolase, partial [Myxococcales bacterium]|nr:haloacid dehalogenase-like hydrolase [Myxococcales bacterium]
LEREGQASAAVVPMRAGDTVGDANTAGASLAPGRWSASNLEQLRAFAATERQRAGDDGSRRVAVFDADGTLWHEDIGEAFLKRLFAERQLVDYDYRRDVFAEYEARCAVDTTAGYGFCAQVMAGMDERRLDQLAAAFYAEFREHRIPEMSELVRLLRALGIEVWIVSASNRWLVRQSAADYGVPPERVLAIHTRVVDGRLTDELIEPVTNLAGKAQAIEHWIGVDPLFAAGNSANDWQMLERATTIRLVINPNATLRERIESEWGRAPASPPGPRVLTQDFAAE